MKRSIPEKSTIWGNSAVISRFGSPSIKPLRKMFSLPESSALNPVPKDSKAEVSPLTVSIPSSGRSKPASNRHNVLLPAPFAPTIPTMSPAAPVQLTSFNAQKSSFLLLFRSVLYISDCTSSRRLPRVNFTPTPTASTSGAASAARPANSWVAFSSVNAKGAFSRSYRALMIRCSCWL